MPNDQFTDLLRRELHLNTENLEPRDDLVDTLRARHGARVRRGRVVTGLSAVVVVAALLSAVFLLARPGEPPAAPPVLDRVVPQARAAFDAADGSILHVSGQAGESWFLRGERLLRVRGAEADTVFTATQGETVSYRNRTVETYNRVNSEGMLAHYAMPEGMFDPKVQLNSDTTLWDGRIDRVGERDAYHLTGFYGPADEPFEIWVDTGNHLPLRVRMAGRSAELDWLPATPGNRRLLTHEVPADFVRPGY
ncbi:hypothetical protein [Amycolatopsis sp. YIM 10]|uniref:hypothetical protein n=1 Tax=Amycolatopsis sp. YIM 10 TaxID=2653857 RepID=UPI0012901815|nr:hypothetical protein [Amycolatopsis sp. YIM 10]QFU90524.1 hypothetical protein YIM_26750 [Amycolatopsis sp. YIM 10]